MSMDLLVKTDAPPAARVARRRAISADAHLALFSAASITVVLAIWFGLAWSEFLPRMLLPSPLDVAQALVSNIGAPFAGATLQQHLVASLGRFFSGFIIAVLFGVPTGLLMGWFTPFRHAITPFFETFRFIAPLAWVPFAALWFGTGIGGPILIVFSGAFAACVINTFRGARMTDERLIEACRTMGASHWRLIVDVLLPSALPSVMAGIRVAAALGWQSLIGAELIVASSGVGYLIVQGQGSVETTIVMAGMVTIGFIGLIIDLGLRLIDARIGRNWRIRA
jgi:NitT/TauT family transport system permease protein